MNKHFPVLLLFLIVNGCTATGQPLISTEIIDSDKLQNCTDLFDQVDEAVVKAGVVDSQAARVDGYPYLRVNRLLSSFRQEVTGPAFEYWVSLMQELANIGWQMEMANLPEQARQELERLTLHNGSGEIHVINIIQDCSHRLITSELTIDAKRAKLRENALVPDDYRSWQRVVGLYPVTALAFKTGINRWHKETRDIFKLPMEKLPVSGSLVQYLPVEKTPVLKEAEVARIIETSSDNPLSMPIPGHADRERLLDTFAPVFAVDEFTLQDRIGTPVWKGKATPRIDVTRSKIYRHISHTRMGERILMQLNYTIWFPSRPRRSNLDLLGGKIDGITWRVTLLPDGRTLIFDSIHNCGCYHLFFPSQHIVGREKNSFYAEPAFLPQKNVFVQPETRPVVRIAAGTHYIQRVTFAPSKASRMVWYQSEAAWHLRSLPLPDGGRRSLYAQDGLVAGTERGERFLFWPMGIPSPGAMRQWGHHATAFVGHRHFDDARLFENSFSIVDEFE